MDIASGDQALEMVSNSFGVIPGRPVSERS